MRSSSGRRRVMAEINIVPYIDVMLVLLVIFMITTPLLTQGVKVNLPKAQAKTLSHEKQQPIILSVDDKGAYYLNIAPDSKQMIAPQDVLNLVAAKLQAVAQGQDPPAVLVKGDQAVDYGKVVEAMVLLQKAGAKQIGLITSPGSHDNSNNTPT